MAAFEVLALDPTTPQIRAPGAADTYTFPRAVAMAVALPVASGGTGTSTPSLVAGANVTISGAWPNQTIAAAGGGGGSSTLTISTKTAAYTVVAGDLGTIINCTANTFTISLTAAATLGSGFNCWIWNNGGGVITIDPNGGEPIDGLSTLILRQGEGSQIVCNGASWETGDKKTMRLYAENLPAGNVRPVASGAFSVAIGRQATSSGNTSLALGDAATASGNYSTAIGYSTNSNSSFSSTIGLNSSGGGSQSFGSGAIALNGSYASGTDSFAAASTNNVSTYGAKAANSIALGATATASIARGLALGYNATTSGSSAIAIGSTYNGTGPTASGSASIAIGDAALASGTYSVAIGAVQYVNGPRATAQGGTAIGAGARATQVGKYAYSGTDLFDGSAFVPGIQYGLLNLGCLTTDATSRILQSDGLNGGPAPSQTNQLALNTYTAFAFTGIVVARQQGSAGTQSAAWNIEGLIRKEAANITTTLVASTVTAISNVPGWTLALSADTTNGALAITATGAAATNIRWFATVQTSEIIYA